MGIQNCIRGYCVDLVADCLRLTTRLIKRHDCVLLPLVCWTKSGPYSCCSAPAVEICGHQHHLLQAIQFEPPCFGLGQAMQPTSYLQLMSMTPTTLTIMNTGIPPCWDCPSGSQMVEAMRPGLLASVVSPSTYAGWDCRRGHASSSATQLAWHSPSFFSGSPAVHLGARSCLHTFVKITPLGWHVMLYNRITLKPCFELTLLCHDNLVPMIIMQAVCQRSTCDSTIRIKINFKALAEEYGELVLDALTAAVNRDTCALDSQHNVCAAVEDACTAAGAKSSCTIQSARAEDRGLPHKNSRAWWIVLWVAVAAFGVTTAVIVVVAIRKGILAWSVNYGRELYRWVGSATMGLRHTVVLKVIGGNTAVAAHLRKSLLGDEYPDPDYVPGCKVCLARACSVVLVPCGHMMCERCVHLWFTERQKTTCPMCRGPVSSNDQKVFAA